MCLAIPAKIIQITDKQALVDFGGLQQTVRLELLPEAKLDDFVIVHAGFAISLLEPEEAEETLRLLKEINVLP